MNSLLDNQKIAKRRYYGAYKPNGAAASDGAYASPEKVRSENFRQDYSRPESAAGRRKKAAEKPAFRPAGLSSLFERNSRLIDNIRQEPARSRRRKPYPNKAARVPEPLPPRETLPPRDAEEKARKLPSFNLPGLPLAFCLILAAGILSLALRGGGIGIPDWLSREVVPLEKDRGSEYNLALYAGVNPPETAPSPLTESPSSGTESALENSGAIPLDLTELFAWQDYKVKRGDSVSKIAAAFSLSMDAIIASNGITNARALREGETIRIPNMDGIPYTVKAGDSLLGISQAMGVPLEVILDVNDIQTNLISTGSTLFIPGARMNREDLKMALGELFMYPVRGARLSSPFGWREDPFGNGRRYHAALDLAVPEGTPIVAAMDGKVSLVSRDMVYGNFIILSHSGGYQTMYAHLKSVSVKKGENVGQGTGIGSVGSTGRSTGPHLHFAVFKNSRAVNPLDYLNQRR